MNEFPKARTCAICYEAYGLTYQWPSIGNLWCPRRFERMSGTKPVGDGWLGIKADVPLGKWKPAGCPGEGVLIVWDERKR
jgi:hypothetical protein